MGNDNLAEETAARLRNSRASISENLNTEANNLLSFNEKLTRDWVKNRKELGELIAFTILKEDAIFLSQGPKSIVCGE